MGPSSTTIVDYLESTYPKDGLLYASIDQESQDILELAITALKAQVNPKSLLNPIAYQKLQNFTGVDFDAIPEQEFISFSFDKTNNTQETSKVDTQDNIKSIACKSYSCGSVLSENYEFANNVEFATCSNSDINGIYCISSSRQYACPVYVPDTTEYASYDLVHENAVYNYSVLKHRHKYGNIIFHIYNQNKDLLNELSFSIDNYLTINPEDLANEIKSIVTQIHRNIFYKDEFSLAESSQNDSSNTVSAKSYIATLIS